MQWSRIGFGLLALGAAVLAACSAGGRAVVPQGFQDTVQRRQPVHATIQLRIPELRNDRRRRMRPQYVSPGTASISFAVQPIATSGPSPTPMPVETFNITTPSPCRRSGGARVCQLTVSVMPGRDSFVVTTFASRNASGKVLSEYRSGSVAIPTPNPSGNVASLGFTLEGVIDHVVLQFPNSVVPADTQRQVGAIPIGVSTSAHLDVTPYDAANFRILSQIPAKGTPVPYYAPVTLSVTPAGGAVTLSNDAGSGNAVTISNPNDLAVNVNYSGAFTASGGVVTSPQSFSIAATGSTLAQRPNDVDVRARHGSPAADAAGVALAGNAIPGGTVTTTVTSPVPAGLVSVPGTNAMAFFGNGYDPVLGYETLLGIATSGVPGTPGAVTSTLAGGFADSLGNLWAFDYGSSRVDCFAPGSLSTPAGTISSTTIVYPGGSVYGFVGFAEDASRDLWFTLYGFQGSSYWHTIGYVPINATSCSAPAAVVYQAVATNEVFTTSLAAIPGTGSVAVSSYDYTANAGAILVAATAAPTPNVTSVALPGSALPEALIGAPSSVYAFANGSSQALGSVSQSGSFAPVVTYPSDVGSFLSQTDAVGASASGLLGLTTYDGNYTASDFVLLVNPADSSASTNLQALSLGSPCKGIAFDAHGLAWTLCTNRLNALQFYRIVPTSTWSVLPGTVIPVTMRSSAAPYSARVYLGILEAFGSTAGPFTVKKYDTNVVSAITPVGDRGVALTLTEPNTGSYATSVHVVDTNGRSVEVTFEIDAVYYVGARHHRGHARRGYPPISRN